MSSVAHHLHRQILVGEQPKLFGAYDSYEAGGQSRDFIYVGDVVAAKLWFLDRPNISGIYNLGTGRAESFKAVAEAVIDYHARVKSNTSTSLNASKAATRVLPRPILVRCAQAVAI